MDLDGSYFENENFRRLTDMHFSRMLIGGRRVRVLTSMRPCVYFGQLKAWPEDEWDAVLISVSTSLCILWTAEGLARG